MSGVEHHVRCRAFTPRRGSREAPGSRRVGGEGGKYEAVWRHGRDAQAGLYFVSHQAVGRTYMRRLVVTE